MVVPPLHHQVVTATLRTGESARDLQAAQAELEAALRGLDERYEPTPAGLGVTVAWGLPYFRRYVAGQAGTHLPVDTRASAKSGKTVRALVNAVRFPSDPPETLLEENDVAVLLRSDSRDAIADGANALFEELDGMFRVTSIRKGFAGGGFDGSQSLPKRMAMAAGVPGADLIPDTSELFLGFTSTQKAGLGPAQDRELRDARLRRPRAEQVLRARHAHAPVPPVRGPRERGTSTSTIASAWTRPSGPASTCPWTRSRSRRARTTCRRRPRSRPATSRSGGSVTAGRFSLRRGSQRTWPGPTARCTPRARRSPSAPTSTRSTTRSSGRRTLERDRFVREPAAGLHFVVFNPSSDDFRRNRLAMDGILPDGTVLPFEPRSRGQGFNAVLQTTHRQNFLVPPRAHRSFPLAELRA